MFEMFDLPNEKELAQIMLEAAKKKTETGVVDTKTIFPFSNVPGTPSKPTMTPDKTGAVKVKTADFKSVDVATAWDEFLKKIKTDGKKPAKELDGFGTVVVSSNAAAPKSDDLVGAVKALKKTSVTDLKGKTTVTTEELGVFKELAKSNAAKPNPNKLVGIVKPKTELGKIAKKPKFDIDASAEVIVKDKIPGIKDTAVKMSPDKTGAVKVKPGVDMKASKTTLAKMDKIELYDDMTIPQTVVVKNGEKAPAPGKMFNHYSGFPEVKVKGGIEPKGKHTMTPDKTGVVKPKPLVTAK